MATGPENLLAWTKAQLQKQLSQDVNQLLAGFEEQVLHAGVKAIADLENTATSKARDLVEKAAGGAVKAVTKIFRF